MNINLLTSFIVAGILLLMLAYMNIGVSSNATEVVVSQSKQSQKLDIQKIISYDFPKIGYNFTNSVDSLIAKADSNRIVFYSNLDNSSDGSVEKITWRLTSQKVTNTTNENDKILKRIVDGNTTEILLGVTEFKLSYFDELGSTVPMSFPINPSDLGDIRQVEVKLVMQSAEKVRDSASGNSDYLSTVWTKRFTPRNLQSNL